MKVCALVIVIVPPPLLCVESVTEVCHNRDYVPKFILNGFAQYCVQGPLPLSLFVLCFICTKLPYAA